MSVINRRRIMILGVVALGAIGAATTIQRLSTVPGVKLKGYVKRLVDKKHISLTQDVAFEPFLGDVYLVNGLLVEEKNIQF